MEYQVLYVIVALFGSQCVETELLLAEMVVSIFRFCEPLSQDSTCCIKMQNVPLRQKKWLVYLETFYRDPLRL